MMVRRLAVSIALLTFIPACDMMRGGSGQPGSGTAKSEVRELQPFTEVDVGGVVNVELAIGATQRVEVSGDDNLVPLVTTAVNQLHKTGGRYALCTMCIGVGQGIAIVIERV